MNMDEDTQALDLDSTRSSQGCFVASLKQCTYEVLFSLYQSSQSPGKISNSKKSSYVVSRVFQSIQMVSILSIAENSTELWDSYGPFWDILQYLRLDFIFARLGLSYFLYLFIEGLVLLSIFLFLVLSFFAFCKKPFPGLIRKTTSLFFAIYCSIFPIPIFIVLLKLSLHFVAEEIEEELTRSPVNLPFAFLSLLSFIFINLLHVIGSAEIRHSAHASSLDSKCSCVFDLKALQLRIAILAFYVLRGRSQVLYLSVCMFIGEGVLGYNFFSMKPHYNVFANKTKIVCSMIVSLSGFAMAMGKSCNNAGVFILLAYIASPLAILCTVWWISGKIEMKPDKSALKQVSEYPRGFKDCWEVEKVLRPYLLKNKKDKKDVILAAFDGFFDCSYMSKDTIFVVWEAYYCFNILADERLSRIKISKRMYSWSSFEGDFQAFSCLKRLDSDKEEYYEDFDFLQFRLRLEENNKRDMKLCENFLLLLNELTQLIPNTKLSNNLLSEISQDLVKVNDEYDDLCTNYNMNKELLHMYQTYLSDILQDKNKARYIGQKHGRSNEFEERDLNWFDEKNSLLIVSGKVSTLGTITYANENASQVFNEPTFNIIGKNIDDYMPSLINTNHNSRLKKFLFFGQDTKIRLPRSSYLVDSKGFLLEVYIKLRCLAIDSYPLFLVVFKPKDRNRDMVLIGKDGNITQYSSRIPAILNLKTKNISGQNLDEILMVYANWGFQGDISFYTLNGYKIYFHQRMVFSYQLNMYRFYPSGSDISRKKKKMPTMPSMPSMKPGRIRQLENDRQIKFHKSVIEMHSEENNTVDSKIASQKSRQREQKSLALHAKTKRCTNLLTLSLFLIVVSSLAINISNSLYLHMGLDGDTYFTSLYKVWNLNTALINISNSARNFHRTRSQVYYDSFEEHIKFFENFRKSQEEVISIFEECGARGEVYDNKIHYWDRYEVKMINLADFSNKLVRYAYDFFDQKETEVSYAFIILNSNSYPMEYLLNLSDKLAECLEEKEKQHEFVLFMIISIGSLLKTIMIMVEATISLEIRKLSVSYWDLTLSILTRVSFRIQNSLVSRLESIHAVDKARIMHHKLRTDKWKSLPLPMKKYIWIPMVIFASSLVYYCILYFMLNKSIFTMINGRLGTIDSIGKLNFEVQKLDYWTRETMIPGSFDGFSFSLQPFKQPRLNLEQVHHELPLLAKHLLKSNSILLLNDEFDLFYDKIEVGKSIIINGIYGNIQMLLMDSIYYSGLTENTEKEYERFSSAIMNLAQIQEKVLYDTVDYSIEYMNEFRLQIVIINLSMVGIMSVFIIIAYLPFIKEENKLLENKSYLFSVINKIQDQESN